MAGSRNSALLLLLLSIATTFHALTRNEAKPWLASPPQPRRPHQTDTPFHKTQILLAPLTRIEQPHLAPHESRPVSESMRGTSGGAVQAGERGEECAGELCRALPRRHNAFLPLWDDAARDVDGQARVRRLLTTGVGDEAATERCSAEGVATRAQVVGAGFSAGGALPASYADVLRERGEQAAAGEALAREFEVSGGEGGSARVVGGEVGRWVRFWIMALDADGVRVCRGGDAWEVRLESARAKVAVDRVMDIGFGVHEVHVFMRKRGVYRLTLDAVFVMPPPPPAGRDAAPPRVFRLAREADLQREQAWAGAGAGTPWPPGMWNATLGGVMGRVEHASGSGPWCPQRTHSRDAVVVYGVFNRGHEVQPRQVPCTRATHPDRFRAGAWVRLAGGVCDDVHCEGSLAALRSDGWVWASDHCVVRIYEDAAAARRALGGHWIVGWGPSTMKQPMANMVEYMLEGQVFPPVTMETLHKWPGKRKRRPNFFSYRQFNAVVAPAATAAAGNGSAVPHVPRATKLSMVWGGCPSIGAAPTACPDSVGLRNRHMMGAYIDPQSGPLQTLRAAGATADAPAVYPTVVLNDHFIWRHPMWDERAFVALLQETVDGFLFRHIDEAVRVGAVSRRRPLVVWGTANHPLLSDSERPCFAGALVNLQRHFQWVIEDAVDAHYRAVDEAGERAVDGTPHAMLLVSRFHITMPFHFTDEWVHFGLHYGATEGMCLTGIDYKAKYELRKCLRRTFPETMVQHIWINAIESYWRF